MKQYLLLTSALVVLSGTAEAACIQTPSCSSLGYDSNSACENGLKCPWGNAWYCKVGGGSSTPDYSKCDIGNIFYSDKTCSVSLMPNKTPIGVIVYLDGQGHGQILGLKSLGKYQWSSKEADVPTLTNFPTLENGNYDLNSCPNTDKIIAAGDKTLYPAAWATHEYSTEGTEAGDWCLPSAGIIASICTNIQKVNIGLNNAGGEQISAKSQIWTSTEYMLTMVGYNIGSFNQSQCILPNYYYNSYDVFPVYAF